MPGMRLALLPRGRHVKALRACAGAARVSSIWPIFAILTGTSSAPCTDSDRGSRLNPRASPPEPAGYRGPWLTAVSPFGESDGSTAGADIQARARSQVG